MKKIKRADNIYIIENFITPKACDNYIQMAEKIGFEEAKVNIGGRQIIKKGVRNNQRIMHKDEQLAHTFWDKLKNYHTLNVGNSTPIGLNEMFRFYKYTKDQRFKRHIDGSYIRSETEYSLYTFMIYLNDTFGGGKTKFDNLEIIPKQGTALIFEHTLKHEGEALTEGEKHVLRTDIMYTLNTNQ